MNQRTGSLLQFREFRHGNARGHPNRAGRSLHFVRTRCSRTARSAGRTPQDLLSHAALAITARRERSTCLLEFLRRSSGTARVGIARRMNLSKCGTVNAAYPCSGVYGRPMLIGSALVGPRFRDVLPVTSATSDAFCGSEPSCAIALGQARCNSVARSSRTRENDSSGFASTGGHCRFCRASRSSWNGCSARATPSRRRSSSRRSPASSKRGRWPFGTRRASSAHRVFSRETADFADCPHLALAIAHGSAPPVIFDRKAARLPEAALLRGRSATTRTNASICLPVVAG